MTFNLLIKLIIVEMLFYESADPKYEFDEDSEVIFEKKMSSRNSSLCRRVK